VEFPGAQPGITISHLDRDSAFQHQEEVMTKGHALDARHLSFKLC
jgi:hypothetical protein